MKVSETQPLCYLYMRDKAKTRRHSEPEYNVINNTEQRKKNSLIKMAHGQ